VLLEKGSVGDHIETWLANEVAVNKSPKTYEDYEATSRLHIVPYLGNIQLTKLSSEDLIVWQATLKSAGRTNSERKRSIRVFNVLLNMTVKRRLIPFNPLMAVDRPRVDRKEIVPLEPWQVITLRDECDKHLLGDLIIFAAMTGMRLREVFGLKSAGWNEREEVVSVRRSITEVSRKTAAATVMKSTIEEKETKTRAGRRAVTLDPLAMRAIRNRRKKAEDSNLGPDLVEYVWCDSKGGMLRGSNFDKSTWYPVS